MWSFVIGSVVCFALGFVAVFVRVYVREWRTLNALVKIAGIKRKRFESNRAFRRRYREEMRVPGGAALRYPASLTVRVHRGRVIQ